MPLHNHISCHFSIGPLSLQCPHMFNHNLSIIFICHHSIGPLSLQCPVLNALIFIHISCHCFVGPLSLQCPASFIFFSYSQHGHTLFSSHKSYASGKFFVPCSQIIPGHISNTITLMTSWNTSLISFSYNTLRFHRVKIAHCSTKSLLTKTKEGFLH